MSTLIATMKGEAKNEAQWVDILMDTDPLGGEIVWWTGDLDIDCDGSGGNPHGDKCFQPDTRLHYRGLPLHAEAVPYLVVPPVVLAKTKGKVLGSLVRCTNIRNGKSALAVVGDSGPSTKTGEGSPRLAELLGLDPNPNHGGTDELIIKCVVYVGTPAVIDGVTYDLQSA